MDPFYYALAFFCLTVVGWYAYYLREERQRLAAKSWIPAAASVAPKKMKRNKVSGTCKHGDPSAAIFS